MAKKHANCDRFFFEYGTVMYVRRRSSYLVLKNALQIKNLHLDNFITKELVFVVVEFILAIFKNFCQSELLICYHVGISPLGGLVDSFSATLFYHKP